MMVSCTKCSKSLKVKDEWAGKMLKCPGCGTTFRADPAGKATAAGKSAPAAAGRAPAKGKGPPVPQGKMPAQKGGGIAINWGKIVMLALLSLIPIGIALFILGPMKVKRQWEAQQEKVDHDVTDVVEFVIKSYASMQGEWDPSKPTGGSPSVGEVRYLPNIFAMSLGPTVRFDGYGSNGRFEGTYTYETGEIEMNYQTGGMMLPSGIYSDELGTIMPGGQHEDRPAGMPAKGGKLTSHRVTGRVKGGGPQAEIDGKKADIYFPKAEDDESATPAAPGKKDAAEKADESNNDDN